MCTGWACYRFRSGSTLGAVWSSIWRPNAQHGISTGHHCSQPFLWGSNGEGQQKEKTGLMSYSLDFCVVSLSWKQYKISCRWHNSLPHCLVYKFKNTLCKNTLLSCTELFQTAIYVQLFPQQSIEHVIPFWIKVQSECFKDENVRMHCWKGKLSSPSLLIVIKNDFVASQYIQLETTTE